MKKTYSSPAILLAFPLARVPLLPNASREDARACLFATHVLFTVLVDGVDPEVALLVVQPPYARTLAS